MDYGDKVELGMVELSADFDVCMCCVRRGAAIYVEGVVVSS